LATLAADPQSNRFPSQIKFIIGNEACERFSYYGMRSILVIFMIHYLMMQESHAKGVYHLFVSANYFLPLLGGYLSDRYLGKYRTIIYLSLVYCAGHAVLAFFESKTGLYWGLGLIALGSGGIKPCVSAHVGDQFTTKNQHLLNKVFELFYFSINFGSFFSTLLIPWILPKFGPSVAFGIPGILMFIATWVFWLGRKQFVIVPPSGKENSAQFLGVVSHAALNQKKKLPGQHWLDVARAKYGEERSEGAKAAIAIFKVFITVAAFWALFDQQGSTWTIQAQKMDLNFFGIQLDAAQIQALNPILVMILIPLFSKWLYPALERRGVRVTPLRKMSVGMAAAGLSFVVAGFFEVLLERGVQVNVAWQIVPYIIITASEILVSITGLEFAYTQAPRAMKSTIMSFWLLTVAVGNFLTAVFSYLNRFSGSGEFFFYAAMMLAVAGIFVLSTLRYKERNYIEPELRTVPA
jgi:proton-dependent oligopeptide transporter, POT family